MTPLLPGKAEVFRIAYKSLCDPIPFSLIPSPNTHSLALSAPTTLAPLPFLGYSKHASTSRPLQWLFPLPDLLFLQISA